MEIGDRIRRLRKGKGLTLVEMEERTGINNGNLSKIENGKQSLTYDTILRIAHALGVPPAQLFDETLGGNTAILRPLDIGKTLPLLSGYISLADIPRGTTVVISGIKVVAEVGRRPAFQPDVEAGNEVRVDEIRHLTCPPTALLTTVVKDRSMAPRLFPGDVLVIDTTEAEVSNDGGVFAFIYAEDIVVRRAYRRPGGGLILHSDNPNVPTINVDSKDLEEICIVGRVKHRSGPGDL